MKFFIRMLKLILDFFYFFFVSIILILGASLPNLDVISLIIFSLSVSRLVYLFSFIMTKGLNSGLWIFSMWILLSCVYLLGKILISSTRFSTLVNWLAIVLSIWFVQLFCQYILWISWATTWFSGRLSGWILLKGIIVIGIFLCWFW